MGSNDLRGEVSVTVQGLPFTLRPTFQALRKIESRTGQGLMILVRQIATMSISYTNLVVILYEALTDAGAKLSEAKVGESVIQEGMEEYLKAMGAYLGSILSRDDIEEGGPKQDPKG